MREGRRVIHLLLATMSFVHDFIVILKDVTNGWMRNLDRKTMAEVWAMMKKAINESCDVEEVVWQKLGDAKFGFKIRIGGNGEECPREEEGI